ncbi:Uncharacterized protein T07A5.1 [Toxocara canis]|uniref:Uncharacterized protein T07A5.1 n=1 Tax=Toxocara canis TaxID=6265 RepID=A0A0B2UQV4_TOXCA|nr:Uncharacterized protein T07A5.1 [Toxocara canis]
MPISIPYLMADARRIVLAIKSRPAHRRCVLLEIKRLMQHRERVEFCIFIVSLIVTIFVMYKITQPLLENAIPTDRIKPAYFQKWFQKDAVDVNSTTEGVPESTTKSVRKSINVLVDEQVINLNGTHLENLSLLHSLGSSIILIDLRYIQLLSEFETGKFSQRSDYGAGKMDDLRESDTILFAFIADQLHNVSAFWLRECDIIYHTYDVDFAFFSHEYYDEMIKDIQETTFMQMNMRLNFPEDLLELKVFMLHRNVDIFFIYNNGTVSWIGGLDGTQRYRFIYPLIKEVCSTILLDYLMYVPCNALDVIKADYGDEWTKLVHSSKYHWNLTPHSVQMAGRYTQQESKNAIQQY